MAKIDKIIAAAKSARRNLADLEANLQEEIDEIRFNAFLAKRKMTDEEIKIRNERRAQKSEARDAFVELTFVTLQRLNQSEEVANLTLRLGQITQDLEDDLETLKKIERYAATAARISKGLANIAKNVASIVV